MTLRAPFPWFGGKSRVADVAWRAFGDVPNYVEPFAGSLAVLLGRPHEPKIETVNDMDCYLANFWRALAADPDAVAYWADWPVNEVDLSARHRWLVDRADFRERMAVDPDYFDAKIAGWWVWGIGLWIGSGWCHVRQLPHLGNAGMGDASEAAAPGRRGQGIIRYFADLAARLRRVRVCCGDWKRVLGPIPTVKQGITAVFLDPPYSDKDRQADLYAVDDMSVAIDVRRWALEHGGDDRLRIVLCGYEGEHEMPGWRCFEWQAKGGYGSQAAEGNDNAGRERLWLSHHCLDCESQLTLPITNRNSNTTSAEVAS